MGASMGAVTVEILRDGTQMEGRLRLVEPGVGELQSHFVGKWTNDNKLSATLVEQFTGFSTDAVNVPRRGTLEGMFDAKENVITGQWRTDVETAGEFRWTQVEALQPMPPDTLATVPAQFMQHWGHFATATKTLLGKSRFARERFAGEGRWKKWLILGLQLSLVVLIGYLLIDLVINVLIGN